MARVEITIEDHPDGKLKIECKPSFEQMIKMDNDETMIKGAHGLACRVLYKIWEETKEERLKLIQPAKFIN